MRDHKTRYHLIIEYVMRKHKIKYRRGGLSILMAEGLALREGLLTAYEIDKAYGY